MEVSSHPECMEVGRSARPQAAYASLVPALLRLPGKEGETLIKLNGIREPLPHSGDELRGDLNHLLGLIFESLFIFRDCVLFRLFLIVGKNPSNPVLIPSYRKPALLHLLLSLLTASPLRHCRSASGGSRPSPRTKSLTAWRSPRRYHFVSTPHV